MNALRRCLPLLAAVSMLELAGADEPGAFATPDEKLDYLLSSWRGKSLEDLQSVWGREESIERRGDNDVYVFERRIKMRVSPFGSVSTVATACAARRASK